MFSYNIRQIRCFKPNSRSVFVRVNTYKTASRKKLRIYEHVHFSFPVVQHAERSYRPRRQAHYLRKVFFGSKAELTCAVFFSELLQIHTLIPSDGYKIIISLFIITHKKIFGVRLRIRNVYLRHLVHGVNRFMLRDFVPNILFFQIIVNFLFVHMYNHRRFTC